MVRTQIQLTKVQAQQLKKIARTENASVAELVRQSVDLFLQTHSETSYEERIQQALAIVGIASSGLGDLSRNHDDYLAEIYGEVEN